MDDEEKEAAARGEEKRGINDINEEEEEDDDDDDNSNKHIKRRRRTMCRTQLGTVYTPYPWRGNSYSIGERRGRCCVIIIIRMGPIGRSIIHRSRHTILK